MKILTKWRNFKNIKAKNREQGNAVAGGQNAITPAKQEEEK
jgi:hypothetical protein